MNEQADNEEIQKQSEPLSDEQRQAQYGCLVRIVEVAVAAVVFYYLYGIISPRVELIGLPSAEDIGFVITLFVAFILCLSLKAVTVGLSWPDKPANRTSWTLLLLFVYFLVTLVIGIIIGLMQGGRIGGCIGGVLAFVFFNLSIWVIQKLRKKI